MVSFNAFIERLLAVHGKADTCGDRYTNIILGGESVNSDVIKCIDDVLNWANENNVIDALNFSVEGESVDRADFSDVLQQNSNDSWKLVISKSALQAAFCDSEKEEVIFFISPDDFNSWVDNIDPLKNPESRVAEGKLLRIYSPTIQEPFGGPFLAVLPLCFKGEIEYTKSIYTLPTSDQITQQVHLVPVKPMRIAPAPLSLTWGNLSQPAAKPFRVASATNLAACMVDVLYGYPKAVIKGMRHLEIPLCQSSDSDVSAENLSYFERAVSWLYEERTDTRSRLLGDRISLDADKEKSVVANLIVHLPESLQQAVDQYRFVVLDRKDEYVKERRDLLKDIRTHSEIYAEKTRSLITSFSRDALAAFVFASFSLTRIFDGDAQTISNAGALFFKVLAVYFGVSILLQISATLRDISSSNAELKKWSQVSREYLTKAEVNSHISDDLKSRRVTFRVFLFVVCVIYAALTLLSWNLEFVLYIYNDMTTNSQQEAL